MSWGPPGSPDRGGVSCSLVNTTGEACGEEAGRGGRVDYPNETRSVSRARHAVQERLEALGLEELVSAAGLVTSELVANAVLHTDGQVGVEVTPAGGGVRLSVFDTSAAMPVVPVPSASSMTGRGLLLVRSLASRFGFEPTADGGKVVWAELRAERMPNEADVEGLIDAWADDLEPTVPADTTVRYRVELGEVPTALLLDAKSHVDNLVREFQLAASGEQSGATGSVPLHLAELIEAVVHRFSEARLSLKRQALEASRQGLARTRLRLDLPAEAAEAGLEYLRALDEADRYCRAARLLTLESPPRHRLFRQWYVGELVSQLQALQSGLPVRPAQTFEERTLQEIDTAATAWAAAERAARLYTVAAALSGALTPEAVAEAVLNEGVGALRASGGGLLLAAGGDRLNVPGTVGYDETLVASLRNEAATAELPAAVALRSGEPVWLESEEERDTLFPELAGMEQGTVSMCAVPLQGSRRVSGALRFSFSQPRLFDEDERRFVLALAALAAQALDRAQLYQDRLDVSARLQQGLLPPALPAVAGVDMAAVYHPFGDGVELGGDFYDVWPSGERWLFAVGDVCGTGPEAATMTALVRHSLRALSRLIDDQAAVLEHLNDILLHAGHDTSERFCTVIIGAITPGDQGVTIGLATGGHPGPILRRADGKVSELRADGSLLGVLPRVEVATLDVTLAGGDTLIFYTDGVTEARDGAGMFGIEGLLGSVERGPRPADELAAALEADVLAHSGGVLRDDMAALVIRACPDS